MFIVFECDDDLLSFSDPSEPPRREKSKSASRLAFDYEPLYLVLLGGLLLASEALHVYCT